MGVWPFSGKTDEQLLTISQRRKEVLDELENMSKFGLRTGKEAGTFAQVTVEKFLKPVVDDLLELQDFPSAFESIYPQRISELVEILNMPIVRTQEYETCVAKMLNLEKSILAGLLKKTAKAA